jgi:23S rRNA (adenine2503-C2)-methyltransferase
MPARLALNALTPRQLVDAVPGLQGAEARKAIAQVHRGEDVHPASGLRRAAVDAIRTVTCRPVLDVVERVASRVDPFEKLLLRAPDGALVESVRIPLEKPGRFSVCVSSQVGCGLGCAFCATGRLGLTRNLQAWEIVEQVRAVRATLGDGQRVHGAVFQGMGEPLGNLPAVLQAIAVLTDPCALSVDARHLTVCTAGLPRGILELARAAPKVRLALSLGSARDEVRQRLMPIARSHSLDEVLAAVAEHARITGEEPALALTLLRGINDDEAEIEALVALVDKLARDAARRPRLSLLRYNSAGDGDPFAAVDDARTAWFRDQLRARGVSSHRRYSGGHDVGAACGQLAGRRAAT